MAFLRPSLAFLLAAAALTIVSPAGAGAHDACAQRVIRDWYSGGRIDGTYPLACYRAAIRALPEDVLQYSNADKDIARALAYAQRGRRDPGDVGPAGNTGSGGAPSRSRPPSPTTTSEPTTRSAKRPAAPVAAPERRAGPRDGSVRLASPPEAEPTGAGLPYPVLVLATLAGILLASAAAAAFAARRR
jgi:hypothetical protein